MMLHDMFGTDWKTYGCNILGSDWESYGSTSLQWSPGRPFGDCLGEMKDELEGDVTIEFVSAGAKNYGYITRSGKVQCKVRGFTFNIMEATWTTSYGKDFTWIVLELIGALEQRIRVATKMEELYEVKSQTIGCPFPR